MAPRKTKNEGGGGDAGVEIPVRIKDKKPAGEPVKIMINDAEAPEAEKTEESKAEVVSKFEETLKEKDERIAQLEEQVKWLSAEFENFRQRQDRKYQDFVKYAAEDVINKFFPVLDSIAQARALTEREHNFESLLTGLEMIETQLKDTFQKLGVEEIKSLGEQFNPELHHAVMTEETNDHPEDTITGEMQKGYIYKDKVIRPAMVKVAKPRQA